MEMLLGTAVAAKVRNARVAMIGAGGIGCELLKNLALAGFGHIELVDLDTIDVTNLNRQFLFQRKHISLSKAHVAAETARKFNPNVTIVSHHGDVKEPKFDLEWFKSFDIVFNALDNLSARRHVNLMCIASNIPLIDAGTGGYQGQSTIIMPGITECYDCHPKPTPKTFPVCTIRNTPSAPIHCIVWARNFLFPQLFQESSEPDATMKEEADTAVNVVEELVREENELKKLRSAMGSGEFPRMVFEKIFDRDLERLVSMADIWKTRKAPGPLKWKDFATVKESAKSGTHKSLAESQRIMSVDESVGLFLSSTNRLAQRHSNGESLSFDKDDEDTMEFVAAAAILRAHVYGIEPRKSYFEIKSMAGNIVPIVATTNAIISGCMIHHAVAVLAGKVQIAAAAAAKKKRSLGTVSLEQPPATVFLVARPDKCLSRENLQPPVANCSVCGKAYVSVQLNTAETTLQVLLDTVLERCPDLTLDNISVMEGTRGLYDPDLEENLDRTLEDLGVAEHHAFLHVDAFDQDDLEVQPLVLYIQRLPEAAELGEIRIGGEFPDLKTSAPAPKRPRDLSDEENISLLETPSKQPRLDVIPLTSGVVEEDDDGIVMVE